MKWKKIVSVILAVCMVSGLAACGKDSGKEESKKTDNDSKDVELTVAIWDSNQEPGLRTIMDGFTEETGVKVDIQVTTWKDYWTMLEAAATGGDMPDVFWMHAHQIDQYAEYDDILLDLTDYVEKSEKIKLDNYPEEISDIYIADDGRVLGVPKDVGTSALWFNKTMFDEAGIEYPDETWTWEKFREVAKQLTIPEKDQYGLAMKPASDQESWCSTVYAYGGEWLSEDKTKSGFDKPETLEAMKLIEGIIQDGSMPEYSVLSENDTVALLESGKAAMVFLGSYMLPRLSANDYVRENCDAAPLPVGPKGRCSTNMGLAWSASAGGEHTEEAWKLIEYLGSEKAQIQQAELGVTMSAFNGTNDKWAAYEPQFNLQVYVDALEDDVIYPYSKNTQVWYQMILDKMVSVWDGKRPMEEVCLEVADEMNAYLAEE
ncbi:sugar ABC transporter substrate-binding protein [Faecalicatena sp. AGMB00832]|uniref:Sugar ABC transporter substrate-binding protein n=1 Tax=Faecalicatena faecalis TaxID=2726362 RepID=A0ABS6D1U0_9FIRM|nr:MULTISPECIES: sugar ABC transporter substrate-binding protein [Faecalicatena]MBU3875156.1 sugar ABC transporter substrate-binding protein [Faecalicatena faecalis]MCI6467785.1 sugar ABC transporter substrate-binding protein [Faecalicatena sp.]MDY5619573.1 sugar ABC transporter substrate-binding protein [Lachnospiraceae bacterium]